MGQRSRSEGFYDMTKQQLSVEKLETRIFTNQHGNRLRVSLLSVAWWGIDTRIAMTHWLEEFKIYWN